MLKHIPNILTISRIVMTCFFIYFLARFDLQSQVIALVIFGVACVTDFLDGFIARRCNVISDWGKVLDPLADKFLILSAFVMFAYQEMMPWWMVIVVAVREIGVTVLRFWLVSRGRVIAAVQSGKIKTVLQMMVITCVLLTLLCLRSPGMVAEAGSIVFMLNYGTFFLMLLMVFITMGSGIEFVYKNVIKKHEAEDC